MSSEVETPPSKRPAIILNVVAIDLLKALAGVTEFSAQITEIMDFLAKKMYKRSHQEMI
ncbi:hypothetical protein [Sphingobium sp. B2D3C]|uniref:hypothetical protein n=1 Tax=Sphingobium sp. B2D3C TaxID=2940581 RepID=UPI0022256DE3|nr:hypothetical protein [Sphingobium sp. B2D3C]